MARRATKQKPVDQAAKITQILTPKKAGASPAPAPAARRHFTADEHIAWAEAECYRDDKKLGWSPLRYSGWQKQAIRKMLRLRPDGTLRYRTIMPCFPRRCDKTGFTACYDLHRGLEYDDQVIVIQANSEEQGGDTVFKQIADTIENSPRLRARRDAGEITVLTDVILFGHRGSIIKLQPTKEASTYGKKISVYHNTELCRAPDDKVFQVGASSTGDAWCGVAIVDSNVGDKDNPVWRFVELAQQAEEEERLAAEQGREPNPSIGDPSIGAVYISFVDLDDVLRRGCGIGLPEGEEPVHPWLDADWIRGRYAQMTRAEFLRNHCNQPTGAGEVLWTDEQIDPLFHPGLPFFLISQMELAIATKLVGGDGKWAIGVGLDRASAFSKLPDRSVLTAVGRTACKAMVGVPVPVYDERGQQVASELCDGTVYVWLGAWEFMRYLRDPIQEKLLQIDRVWGIGQVCLEQYQASDLGEWCQTKRFGDRTSLEHLSSQAKQQLVQFTHSLVSQRRVFISPFYSVLRAEFTNYREVSATSAGGIPGYEGRRKTTDIDFQSPLDGHTLKRAETWIKDDYLESGMWALYAARNARARSVARILPKPLGL
jgi:hypothetical protein